MATSFLLETAPWPDVEALGWIKGAIVTVGRGDVDDFTSFNSYRFEEEACTDSCDAPFTGELIDTPIFTIVLCPITGQTVLHVRADIARDDGLPGSGQRDSWSTNLWALLPDGRVEYYAEGGLLAEAPSALRGSLAAPHVMGLSRETLDIDAYNEFMKGL